MQNALSDRDIQQTGLIVGVDVGGTKIVAGVVDAQGQVCGRVQLPTETSQPEMVLQSIEAAIRQSVQAAGVNLAQLYGIGLGVPGEIDPLNGICRLAVNLGWQDVPVVDWLAAKLQLACPIAIENDVSAAALGEQLYGVGRDIANLVYLSLGTGIASKAIIEGKLHRGIRGLAGEIGHTTMVPDGPLCRCGGRGCLDVLAAGPALARRVQEEIQSGKASLLQAPVTTEQVFFAAAQGDDLAQQILAEAASHIALAIYQLAMNFDPQVIVLGGGLALEDGLFMEMIRAETARWATRSPVFQRIYTPNLLCRTALKRDVAILGAAALVSSQQEK